MTSAKEPVEIRIAKDRMKAEMRIATEGVTPPIAMLRAMLANRGVLFGLKDERIAEAGARRGEWIVVAEGVPPRPPVHGRVQPHVETSAKPRAQVDEDGSANLKELGILENVTSGMLLASIVDPIPGSAGRDVSGTLLPPEPARPAVLRPGRNTSVSPDGRELYATIDGRVVLEKDGRISVDNIFTVAGDVGPATGNINFLGSVIVLGNVCTDYRIRAAERIVVKGAVEGAVLEAGQDITVHGGVFGAEKAILQTPGSIILARAQECRLLCGGSIHVQDTLLRVNAVAGQSIIVERGAIIGGSATAPRIQAPSLGAESETRTLIEAGIAPRAKLTGERLQSQFLPLRRQLITARGRLAPLIAAHNAGKILEAEDRNLMQKLEIEVADLEPRILELAAAAHALLADPASTLDGAIIAERCRPGVVLASLHTERTVQQEARRLVAKASSGKLSGGKDGGGQTSSEPEGASPAPENSGDPEGAS